jgi:hypothetical protein
MRRPLFVSRDDSLVCARNQILERRLPGKFGGLFCSWMCKLVHTRLHKKAHNAAQSQD